MADDAPYQAPRRAVDLVASAKQLAADVREAVENTGHSAHGDEAMAHANAAVLAAERHVAEARRKASAGMAASPVVLMSGSPSPAS